MLVCSWNAQDVKCKASRNFFHSQLMLSYFFGDIVFEVYLLSLKSDWLAVDIDQA